MNRFVSSFIIILLVCIIIPGCSSSEDTKEPDSSFSGEISAENATDEVDIQEPHNSFLWEVTSDTTTVFVLGSIHLASADLYPLASAIETAYGQAENLAVEFDVTNADNFVESATLLIEKGKYPNGETLRDNIPEELYDRTYDVLKDLGMSDFELSVMKSFEPWVFAMEIEVLAYQEYGFTSEYGIDQYFLNKAHEESKDIIDLESAELQINLFDNFTEEQYILLLEDAVENIPTKQEIEHLFEIWELGDAVELEKVMFDDLDEHPEFIPINEELVDKRNFGMVEKIEDFLQDDEIYFVVVGAGHLIGENGIINLLEEKGYPTEQL